VNQDWAAPRKETLGSRIGLTVYDPADGANEMYLYSAPVKSG